MSVLKRFKTRERKKVMKYIRKKRKSGPLHFTLIDPDKQTPAKAAKMAYDAEKAGSDAIMIGGSQAAQAIYQDDTIQEIKKKSDLPVILFPSSHAGISGYADAVFFMSLLNSRTTQYMVEEQVKGSVIINKYRLEALPMGYLIVESGNTTSAAWVGDVRPIPRKEARVRGGIRPDRQILRHEIRLPGGRLRGLALSPQRHGVCREEGRGQRQERLLCHRGRRD